MDDRREIIQSLREVDGVTNISLKRSRERDGVYIAANIPLEGIRLHDLHDEYEFEVRSVFHDPTKDMLDITLWP